MFKDQTIPTQKVVKDDASGGFSGLSFRFIESVLRVNSEDSCAISRRHVPPVFVPMRGQLVPSIFGDMHGLVHFVSCTVTVWIQIIKGSIQITIRLVNVMPITALHWVHQLFVLISGQTQGQQM